MTCALVDFHCHLDLYPEFGTLVGECERLGIYTLAVTTTPRAWSRNRNLAAGTRHVRASLGIHPQLVDDFPNEIDLWELLLPEARYVGEVGLDAGPRFHASLDRQKEVFRRVLVACAQVGKKVISVHSVRAASAVLDLVETHLPVGRGTVVLHWFTGSPTEARRAVGLGCYFSVNGEMLRNEKGRKLVTSLPAERLLTETDGPFVSRECGSDPIRPLDVGRTVAALAQTKRISEPECAKLVLGNLRRLTGTPDAL